jgi:hypothetical protein
MAHTDPFKEKEIKVLENKDKELSQEIEKTYLEFDQVMENLSSDKPKSPPPWVVTNPLDPRYFDIDEILERLKYTDD